MKIQETGCQQTSLFWILVTLFSRIILFPVFQAFIALFFVIQGVASAWNESIAWWPVTAILTNIVCLALMNLLLKREGLNLFSLYRFDYLRSMRNLLLALGGLAIAAVLTAIPNTLGALLLFGDRLAGVEMMFRPLPAWSVWMIIAFFPVTVALTELPMYFGYVMPRLKLLAGRKWIAVVASGFCFGAQHAFLPLIFDWRFILWRLIMLMLFTLFVAILLNWRPRLLPFYLIGHFIINLQFALLLF